MRRLGPAAGHIASPGSTLDDIGFLAAQGRQAGHAREDDRDGAPEALDAAMADTFAFRPSHLAAGFREAAPRLLDGAPDSAPAATPASDPDSGSPDGMAVSASLVISGAAVTLATVAVAMPAATAVLSSYTSGLGGLGVDSDFNIRIIFAGDWSAELQEDFILAAEYLSTLITGDLPNSAFGDDITIVARLSDIDGEGGVLGQAGPLAARRGSNLPTLGIMEFDLADADAADADALFDDIVTHEMMHTLGFGTMWEAMGLVEGSVRGGDVRFTGDNARAAYRADFPLIFALDGDRADGVPVETDGGPGTAGGHWDDDTFGSELMTGFIDDPNFVSAMTVAALEDMGYETVFDPSRPGAAVPQPDDLLALA